MNRGIFPNLVTASDCVKHKILLAQLYFYGIHRAAANWFRSYVTGRKQKVEIK
jgi:hypothetical protein